MSPHNNQSQHYYQQQQQKQQQLQQQQQQQFQGILLVRPLQAKLERDTEFAGTMDCYCQVIIGTQKAQSHVHKGSGKFPRWQSSMQFKIQDEDTVRFIVWDKETVKSDDLVGEMEIELSEIFKAYQQYKQQNVYGVVESFQLNFMNDYAGELEVEFEFISDALNKEDQKKNKNGTIILKPYQAKLIRDTELIGSMDPFVEIEINGKKVASQVHHGGGKNPFWKDNVEIRREKGQYFATIRVCDQDQLSVDVVGEAQIPLKQLFTQQVLKNQSTGIYYKGQESGTLYYSMEWIPDQEERSGTLIAYPQSANLTRDTEFGGNMDPFCVITIGNMTQKTQVHNKGGKYPRWNDKLELCRSDEFEAIVQVWDEDKVYNDLVGEARVSLQQIFNQQNQKSSIQSDLSYKGKSVGNVTIRWQWIPDEEVRPGMLFVSPLSADLKNDTEMFSKMDPYVEIKMGNQIEKSQVHKKGGKNPKWDQTLTLRRLEHNYLEIKVKDKDQFSDDLIGEAQIPLYSILKNAENKQYNSTVELKYKNKNAGSINLEWKWNPDTELRQGLILVNPIKADLTRDTELVGKMDCYVKLRMDQQQYQTGICENGGKNPFWKQQPFEFQRTNQYCINFEIFDKDVTYDDKVGSGSLNLIEIFNKKTVKNYQLPLKFGKKNVGVLYLDVEWQPEISEADKKAEERVREINIKDGKLVYHNNLTQYMIALTNFDLLVLDDLLVDLFVYLVKQDYNKCVNVLDELLKNSEKLCLEGFSELCRYYQGQIEQIDLPSQSQTDRLMFKLKKFLQLTQILKIEIGQLANVPSDLKIIEILQEQVAVYEVNPEKFDFTQLQKEYNELQYSKQRGDFARKQLKIAPTKQQQYSANYKKLQKDDIANIEQSRAVLLKAKQDPQLNDDNYYFTNHRTRLAQDENYEVSKDYQYAVKSTIPKFVAQDWINQAQSREEQIDQQKKQHQKLFSDYEGMQPKFNREEIKSQINNNQVANQWLEKSEAYYNNPNNLPDKFKSPEKNNEQYKSGYSDQKESENRNYKVKIDDQVQIIDENYQEHKVKSYRNQNQQDQNNSPYITSPEYQDNKNKQDEKVIAQSRAQQNWIQSQSQNQNQNKNENQIQSQIQNIQHQNQSLNNSMNSSRLSQGKKRIFDSNISRPNLQGSKFVNSQIRYQQLGKIQEEDEISKGKSSQININNVNNSVQQSKSPLSGAFTANNKIVHSQIQQNNNNFNQSQNQSINVRNEALQNSRAVQVQSKSQRQAEINKKQQQFIQQQIQEQPVSFQHQRGVKSVTHHNRNVQIQNSQGNFKRGTDDWGNKSLFQKLFF